jgi:pilus assembly protein CpaE
MPGQERIDDMVTAGLRVLAIVRTPELAQVLNTTLGRANGTRLDVRVGDVKRLGVALVLAERPDAVLLDIDPEDPEDWEVISQVKHHQALAGVPVLATADKITSASIRRLLRDGVDDFVPQPPTAADIMEALESAQRKIRGSRRPAEGQGRIVTFVRAAGGMGATTLAVHGALSLLGDNDAKERGGKQSVCLLDLDLQFGTTALSLDLVPSDGLLEIMRTPSRLDGALLRGAMVPHSSGLHVLTAPRAPVPLDALNPAMCARILEVARHEFAYVVVDTPPSLTTWTESLLALSDVIYLVAQLTLPALAQARRLLDALEDEGHYDDVIRVVLNRYRKQRFGQDLGMAQAEKVLNRKVQHLITNDYGLVTRALNEGVSMYHVKRRSAIGEDIATMVGDVLKKTLPAAAAPARA